MFHVERIYKCNHAGGQAGPDRRAPQRAGQEQRMPAPQGLGKNQECLPPRAWEGSWQGSGAKRSCLAMGLPKPLGQTIARLAAPPCRLSWFLPSPWDKQSRGLPRHHAGFLCSCPALWDKQSRGLPRHLCPSIRPCLPPCYLSSFSCWADYVLPTCRGLRVGSLHLPCMIRG